MKGTQPVLGSRLTGCAVLEELSSSAVVTIGKMDWCNNLLRQEGTQ